MTFFNQLRRFSPNVLLAKFGGAGRRVFCGFERGKQVVGLSADFGQLVGTNFGFFHRPVAPFFSSTLCYACRFRMATTSPTFAPLWQNLAHSSMSLRLFSNKSPRR